MAEGSVLSCSNLQWRSVSNQRKIPSVFASEITSFSLNPKETHLQQSVAELKSKIVDKDVEDLVHQARAHILQTSGFRDSSSSPAPSSSSPLSSVRGTPAHKKLKLMSRIGEDAPPLSPIPLIVTTRHVFQNFKSPCRTPLGPGKSKPS
uniref:BRCA2 OB3 domain-containing protein n=1 Tax=Lygus hesperus TaxID=30085 RepID=A0A0K8SZ28_LYGHE